MSTTRLFVFGLIMSALLSSCMVFQKGYINEHGQYLPKRPNFGLADANRGDDKLIAGKLYELREMTTEDFLAKIDTTTRRIDVESKRIYSPNTGVTYIWFYERGKFLSFTVSEEFYKKGLDSLKVYQTLPSYKKGYYQMISKEEVKTEIFILADGYGRYITRNYRLAPTSGKLIFDDQLYRRVYQSIAVPKDWAEFEMDW